MAKKQDATLQGLYDTGALMAATDERLKITRVSSGIPQVDELIGGGLVFGRNVLCVGPESTGKTLLAQHAVAQVQQLDPESKVLLLDAEFSYDPAWWAMSGVDLDRLLVSQPPYGEEAINTMMALCGADPTVRMVVIDSLATLNPAPLVDKSAGERSMAPLAYLLWQFYAKVPQLLKRGVLIYAINQMRANLSGYDDVYPGGKEQRHNSHLILRLRRDEWIREGEQRVGYQMEVHVKKTKIGGLQEGSCFIPVRFASQLDLVSSYIDEALEKGSIKAAGPWYSYGDLKWMGKSAMREAFLDNEGLMHKLKSEMAS